MRRGGNKYISEINAEVYAKDKSLNSSKETNIKRAQNHFMAKFVQLTGVSTLLTRKLVALK